MSYSLLLISVQRQSTMKFDTIFIILNSHRYKKRVASKRDLKVKMKHRVELEARNASIRFRLVSLEDNIGLSKSKY